ncbi:interleukin enhancer-binding factor 2 homolog [Corticium candelabrum]|uniref:interleukin enhancer-binding factor 2 homolog n=1 Tax=Corticium candelabrum TaxID=121492 RepID=UPI002E257F85|nr:interleukin enhancer-binding factor 2 homolog [Corticium candelabrum]
MEMADSRGPLLDTPFVGEAGVYVDEYDEVNVGDLEGDEYVETQPPMKQLYIPFDLTEASELFTSVAQPVDSESFSEAILQRSEQITPSADEQASVNSLTAKVTSVLEAMSIRQELVDGMGVEEIRSVGAYKKGTQLAGDMTAEVAVILKNWPTYTAVEEMAQLLKERVASKDTQNEYVVDVTETSITVCDGIAQVTIMVMCFPQSVQENQTEDTHQSENRVPLADIDSGLAAIRHTRWFDENVIHTSVKILARLLKDLCQRITQLRHLNDWHCELLAHFCVLQHSNNQPLPVTVAFKRFLQLMSAGFFLPDSVCIDDPCEADDLKVHQNLTYDQMEEVTTICQCLLRLLTYGAHREILGVEPGFSLDFSSTIEYGGVTISPPQHVLPPTQIVTQ